MRGTSLRCGLAAIALIASGTTADAIGVLQMRSAPAATAAGAAAATGAGAGAGAGAAAAVATTTAAGAAAAAASSTAPTAQVGATPSHAICVSRSHRALAARMSARLAAVLRRRRRSNVALDMADQANALTCRIAAGEHFDSASVIKATILAALLRGGSGTRLSAAERTSADRMITESDNDAATALWRTVRGTRMRRFLALANMTHTIPGPGHAWGLTQITARDELRQLRLLTSANPVLTRAARGYELSLMRRVDPAQRWGVPAGAPAGMKVEVKNGWLPLRSGGWHVNSIGCVSGGHRQHCMAVLSDGNPSMGYGVRTVAAVASAINRALAAHRHRRSRRARCRDDDHPRRAGLASRATDSEVCVGRR